MEISFEIANIYYKEYFEPILTAEDFTVNDGVELCLVPNRFMLNHPSMENVKSVTMSGILSVYVEFEDRYENDEEQKDYRNEQTILTIDLVDKMRTLKLGEAKLCLRATICIDHLLSCYPDWQTRYDTLAGPFYIDFTDKFRMENEYVFDELTYLSIYFFPTKIVQHEVDKSDKTFYKEYILDSTEHVTEYIKLLSELQSTGN